MSKKTLLFVCLFIGIIGVGGINAQGYTPPSMVFGISLDGNLATNDAHGSALDNTTVSSSTYGMVWGRGASLYAKFGLGVRKNHRITVAATYNKMVHDDSGEMPFFNFSPVEPYTNYDVISGAFGYEYSFNPRCKNKQYIGFAVTTNYIVINNKGLSNAPASIENSFRIGLQVTSGYEWTLDKAQTYGIFIGVRYNLTNILGTKNADGSLNDGSGTPGPGFWRRIGFLSLNLGFNLYSGVKPYRAK
ncbi:MAG: hypothetical protein PHN88_00690 [Ignavibacteria bacterium]|nr:hypothetical protein [Ignavibacteria bacterium]